MNNITVCALYKFTSLKNFESLKQPLQEFCLERDIKGTLLLAHEGINGTVAGNKNAIDELIIHLKTLISLEEIDYKTSFANEMPFYRMKVKLKKEIVTMGVCDIDPSKSAGTYVDAKDWNTLISDPDVILIDTRNDYECEVGTFEGAINPNTESFRQFPAYAKEHLDKNKHKKVAMFCTGGIRCEKSTAHLIEEGFENVYHLKGGILKYLEEVPEEESMWKGECFVFDQRVTVKHGLEIGSYDLCHGCRNPISEEEKASSEYEEGVSCPKCFADQTDEQRARFQERQKQIRLSKMRGEEHMGKVQPNNK